MNIYALSDLHGRYDILKEMLDFLQPDDKVYFLGDAIDRGPHGIKIVQHLLKDKRFIYLKGNHEELMLHSLDKGFYGSYQWSINGNESTLKELESLQEKEKLAIFQTLSNLPVEATYYNKNNQKIILCHAGYTPEAPSHYSLDKLWCRDHFFEDWADDENTFLIHGHTPVQFLSHLILEKDLAEDYFICPRIFPYCDGHKIDIDLGCFTESNRGVLLNLDTFKPIYFTV